MAKSRSALLLTVTEAAELLGVSRSTLYAALKAGTCELRTVVIGKQVRIPRAAVEELAGVRPGTAQETPAGSCESCGASRTSASSKSPTCSAAFWSSSVTGSV
jgi:excisionase family DNA binding protein